MEQFRREIQIGLAKSFTPQDVDKIMRTIDKVLNKYDVTSRETSIVPYVYELPREVQYYFESRRLEGSSIRSIQNYTYTINAFFDFTRKSVKETNTADVRAFLIWYKETHNISDATLGKKQMYLHSFFAWCVSEGIIDRNPCDAIKKVKAEKKQRVALTRDELEELRNVCQTSMESALIEVMYSSGARIGEMVKLKWQDIEFDTDEIRLFGKGKKQRTSFISSRAKMALKRYIAEDEHKGEYVFHHIKRPYGALSTQSLRARFESIVSRTTIEKTVTPHILRHTFATLALEAGMPIEHISALLGHEQISTTQIYAHLSKSMVSAEHRRCIA